VKPWSRLDDTRGRDEEACSQVKVRLHLNDFFLQDSRHITPLPGAVGPLQFEVLQYRLKDE